MESTSRNANIWRQSDNIALGTQTHILFNLPTVSRLDEYELYYSSQIRFTISVYYLSYYRCSYLSSVSRNDRNERVDPH